MASSRPDAAAAHAVLRAGTASCHIKVDEAFASFDLGRREDYGTFLRAHARALPPVEAALAEVRELPRFRPRTPALTADLETLAQRMPPPLSAPIFTSVAAAFGALYVIEGSRLGGAMLVRAVPEDLPRAYLGATHERGAWRGFLLALDQAAAGAGEAWIEEALTAAEATFGLYLHAAMIERAEV